MLGSLFGSDTNDDDVHRRLVRLERKLDLILAHLGVDWDAHARQEDSEMIALLAQGKKIDAIKVYRAKTGASLGDAKAYVESIEPQR
jgi:ribosomal protein L7/L12